jgi:hypothetical protein
MNLSRPAPIHPLLPDRNVESDLAFIDVSDSPSSQGLPCPGNYLETHKDQLISVPTFDYDAAQIVDPHLAPLPLNVDIMSGILED